MKFYHIIILVLSLLLLFTSISLYRCRIHSTPLEPQIDTVFVTDTILDQVPVPVTNTVVKTLRVPFPVEDTLNAHCVDSLLGVVSHLEHQNDSLFLVLERIQKEYITPEYHAWVSGYDPQLDSIEVYKTTVTIEKTVQVPVAKRWSIGPQVGVGLTKNSPSVYVGVGVQYNLFSF